MSFWNYRNFSSPKASIHFQYLCQEHTTNSDLLSTQTGTAQTQCKRWSWFAELCKETKSSLKLLALSSLTVHERWPGNSFLLVSRFRQCWRWTYLNQNIIKWNHDQCQPRRWHQKQFRSWLNRFSNRINFRNDFVHKAGRISRINFRDDFVYEAFRIIQKFHFFRLIV